jgi:hypothetical protein
MIDLASETPLSLAAATRLIPPGRNGRKTHISTLLRWIFAGVRGPNGTRVHLEAARLGARWITSQEAIQRFMESLTPQTETPPTPTPPTAIRRRRASEQATSELEKLGI